MSSEQLSIRIGEIAPHQFVNHYFDVPITFFAERSDIKADGIPLSIQLRYEGGGVPDASLNLLTVDPRTPAVIKSGGHVVVRVMINLLSVQCENKKFFLHVTGTVPTGRYVAPGVSTHIRSIRHMLNIVNRLPELWFKDEGGRDKCMELMVQLVNSSGHLVTDRKVPLKLVLKYENNNDVVQQELFKISPECRRYIDDTGSATIKFRVEDVSKNHQKQSFGIMVAPDVITSPQCADIGSANSTFVDIKSKRNKRKAMEEAGELDGSRHVRFSDSENAPAVISGTLNQAATAAVGPRIGSPNNPAHSVYTWVNQVLYMMDTLSWKLVGYERRADGGEDRSKPLYSMNNPNQIIEHVKTQFTQMQIQECLLALASAHDASSGNSAAVAVPVPGPTNSRPPSLERSFSAISGLGPKEDEVPRLPSMPPRPPSLSHQSSTTGLQWPSTWRQKSVDEFFGNLDSFMNSGSGDFGGASFSDQYQKNVESILAIEYCSLKTKKVLGLPAFDGRGILVGFYKYDQTTGTSLYYTAEELENDLSSEDRDNLYGLISGGNSLLCSIDRSGDHARDLDRLRESAFFKFWGSSI